MICQIEDIQFLFRFKMEPQMPKRRKLASSADMSQTGDESKSDLTSSAPTNSSSIATTPAQDGPVAGMKRNREQSASAPYAGEAYKSSLFKLQVDEMLTEVRPNYAKRLGPVDNALRKLKTLIEAIPGREPLPVSWVAILETRNHMLKYHLVP